MTYSLYDKQGRGASGPMSKAIMPDGHDGKRPSDRLLPVRILTISIG